MKYKLFISGMRVLFAGLMIFSLTTGIAFSQEKTIQIVGKNTSAPVSDVYFKYGDKTGFSGDSGEISIEFSEKESLWLSHLLYGRIWLSSEEVKLALETGRIKLKLQEHSILPVTVISVHPSAGEISSHTVEIQDKLEHDAGQLLDRFSGISTIRKSAAYGFDPVLRGFKYDQLNLVIDGVHTASAACPNRMDPASSQIPVNMIAEVEVLKGPFSLRYGNVFGGTINFKTNLPQFSEKLKLVGRLGTSYESNGGVFRTEGIGGFTSQSADVKFFASYSKGSDFTDGNGNTVPANFNRLNWGGKLGFRLGEKQTVGFLVSNNRAHDVDFPTLPMDLREDNTWLLNANHTLFFNRKNLSSLHTALYTTKVDHLMDNLGKVINPRSVDAVSDASTLN